MNHFIIKTIIATTIFTSFFYSQELIEKKNTSEIENSIQDDNSAPDPLSAHDLGKSTMNFILKNWVKLACPTIGLGLGVSIGAHMADDYGMPIIGVTTLAGLATGYMVAKKITLSLNKNMKNN